MTWVRVEHRVPRRGVGHLARPRGRSGSARRRIGLRILCWVEAPTLESMSLPAPNPDRTCLVTGASSGIGAEIAGLLAARGLGVTLVARREAKLRALADELGSRHGVRAEVIAADLTDEESRRAIATELTDRSLSVNVLVNNAGMTTVGPVHASDPEREVAMIRTDVEAVVHLCSLFLPAMVERRSGAVLNVASTGAFQPLPGHGRLRGQQGLRAVLQPRPPGRAAAHRGDGDRALSRTGAHRLR
jgi:NAD(P)-dependent dehydrogenase (short-subunit alcohol dehydrogenase family)